MKVKPFFYVFNSLTTLTDASFLNYLGEAAPLATLVHVTVEKKDPLSFLSTSAGKTRQICSNQTALALGHVDNKLGEGGGGGGQCKSNRFHTQFK